MHGGRVGTDETEGLGLRIPVMRSPVKEVRGSHGASSTVPTPPESLPTVTP